ncbi:MAG: hypothetical protein NT019_00715 [Candidatus Adlerbacteria bacterium]|nr:hypothetical protein [Candidatus Adlerbacteria bacterium]
MNELALLHAQTWAEDPDFVCRKCGNPARKELEGSHRWGCLTCKATTINPDTLFAKKKDPISA